MSKVERPFHTPECCGMPSTWVEHSVNLAYFFCHLCRLEVKGVSGVGGNAKWDALNKTETKEDANGFWGIPTRSYPSWKGGGDPGGLLPQGASNTPPQIPHGLGAAPVSCPVVDANDDVDDDALFNDDGFMDLTIKGTVK